MTVTVTRDNTKALLASIKRLTDKQVLVGIPSENADRDPDPNEPQPANNATIGYIMETGSPAKNIPARPHLVPGIELVQDQITARYAAGAKAVLDGRITDFDQVHTAVGMVAENSIKKKITDGPFTPLAPSTLSRRESRGRTGTKPLIDTGQYRRAITHVIRPKGR